MLKFLRNKIKVWLGLQFKDPFTVACDLSPFWNPINVREELEKVDGLFRARRFARRWLGPIRWVRPGL